MRTLRRRTAAAALAAAAAALWASGCDGADAPPTGPAPATSAAVAVERPHFEGQREVHLALGPAGATSDCDEDTAPEWVCDPGADRPPPGSSDGVLVLLREARMDVAGGGTSWRVTLRFAAGDRADLADVRDDARRMGAPVLLLAGDRVLTSATAGDLGRGVIRLSRMSKPDAWDTVERIAAE